MAISKARKDELLAQYTSLIDESSAMFFAEYTGTSVKAMDDLRGKVYEAEGTFHVTKNTLLSLALENAEYEIPSELLQGQLATGFALKEAPTLAKALVDYADKSDSLALKGGLLGNKFLTPDEIGSISKITITRPITWSNFRSCQCTSTQYCICCCIWRSPSC